MRHLKRGQRDPDMALMPEVKETLVLDDFDEETRTQLRADIAAITQDTALSLAKAGARTQTILKALGIPRGLEGQEAEDWCAQELVNMKVLALAIQKDRMLHGSRSEAADASKTIITVTEKDKSIHSVAPIVIINNGAQPPWRGDKVDDVVEGVVESSRGQHDTKVDDVVALPTSVAGDSRE